MLQFGWLHSPAVTSTVSSATGRYEKFFELTKQGPGKVPALDVDLIWHTQQLSPQRNLVYCKLHNGGIVDHDNKVGKEVLHGGFARTRALYLQKFGVEYRVCHSWRCEALRTQPDDGVEDVKHMDALVETGNARRAAMGNGVLLWRLRDQARCGVDHELRERLYEPVLGSGL